MRISTKGQYALLLMLDLAIHNNGEYISVKSIAKRQNLSEKYLEQIVSILSRAGLVRSTRGIRGGHCLNGRPEDFTVGMILRAIEGSLAPVDKIDNFGESESLAEECVRNAVWIRINNAINDVVDTVTIGDLLKLYQDKLV